MNQLEKFIAALKDQSYFEQVGPAFALIEPGNWHGFVQWGKECGYQLTLKDFMGYVEKHPHIFDNIPADSRLSGWSVSSLQSALNLRRENFMGKGARS